MMHDCVHLGGRIPSEEPLHLCEQVGQCDESICIATCPAYRSKHVRGDCIWRDDHVRDEPALLCGMSGQVVPIFRCEIHGECSTKRYCHNQKARSCLTCSDHEDDDGSVSRRVTLEFAKQIYSPETQKFEGVSTPIPADVSWAKRHLIYHVWPRSGNGTWQWNVEQLLKRIELFSGVRTIGIACGGDADSVEDVKAAFAGHRIDKWIIRDNDSHKGESSTFRAMLRTLPADGVTFYGHAKGVKYGDGDDEKSEAVRMWTELMYNAVVDDWNHTEAALSQFPVAGCLKDNFHHAVLPASHHWHFAGTYFWFRNRDVFQRPEWRSNAGGYYAVELWPSKMFKSSEAKSLFWDLASHFGRDLYTLKMQRELRSEFEQQRTRHAKSISVVIATLGRKTLPNVIRAIQRQLDQQDEIIVVCDGIESRERAQPEIEGVRYLVHSDSYSRFGNAQKRFGQQEATKDLIWFVDDDDMPHPGAINTIKSMVRDKPIIFRMQHMERLIWEDREIRDQNVGSPMLVVPNIPEMPLYPGCDAYAADLQWMKLAQERFEIEWSERVVYSVERQSVGNL